MQEKIIKKPSEIIIGETYRFYFKRKPKEEPFNYLDGIVDWLKKTKIRIAGIFKNNRHLKLIDFNNFQKVVRPQYDIVLPTEIISKTLIQNKERFDCSFYSTKVKIKICNSEKLLNVGKKLRYWFPEPASQDYLYVDCIIKEKLKSGYVFESLDTKDGRSFVMYINKNSNALIQFLNKNVKIPFELREPIQHLNVKDNKYFSNIKEKNVLKVKTKKRNVVAVKDNKKAEEEKILSAISKKKKIKEEEGI